MYKRQAQNIAAWGDDSQTPQVDGALSDELILFQFVNGLDLYQISTEQILYSTNSFNTLSSSSLTLICTIDQVLGCTDETALNFDADANTDDESCDIVIEGCTDSLAFNYNVEANTLGNEINGCLYSGCTIDIFPNYNSVATVDDGSCSFNSVDVFGCMDELYLNYDSTVNISNNTCDSLIILGCTNTTQFGYNSLANIDDGSCEEIIEGCIDSNYFEYSSEANTDDGSCMILIVAGCLDSQALNYDDFSQANFSDASLCEYEGCTDSLYIEYNPLATQENKSCDVNKR